MSTDLDAVRQNLGGRVPRTCLAEHFERALSPAWFGEIRGQQFADCASRIRNPNTREVKINDAGRGRVFATIAFAATIVMTGASCHVRRTDTEIRWARSGRAHRGGVARFTATAINPERLESISRINTKVGIHGRKLVLVPRGTTVQA